MGRRKGGLPPSPNQVCPTCGKDFYRAPSSVRGKIVHCSKDCYFAGDRIAVRKSKYDDANYIGQRFGSRVVLDIVRPKRGVQFKVECDCGHVTNRPAHEVVTRRLQSCSKCAHADRKTSSSSSWLGGKHIPLTMYSKWERNAYRRDIDWNVSLEYLDDLYERQNFKCVYTGDTLTFDKSMTGKVGRILPGTCSLDRIDADKGYIEGNVAFCTKAINVAKQRMSPEGLVEMCRKVVNYHDSIGTF